MNSDVTVGKLRQIWWICDGCGRERFALHRPSRCMPDRLGKHPVMRPMGPRFVDLAWNPGDQRGLTDLVLQTGMSRQSLGPMFLSRLVAQEETDAIGASVPNPSADPKESP